MIRRLLAVALFAAATTAASAWAQERTPARAPVLVELYTSQGCFSCPRANRLLGEFSRDPGIVALTFPVGYWDYLGWSDTFAQPEFVSRQRDFSRALRFRAPYTPQLIIDGMRQVGAGDWDESRAALEEVRASAAAEGAPTLSVSRTGAANNFVRVNIGASSRRFSPAADIWMVAYDPGPLTVYVVHGDNAGRNVTHFNVVQRVTRVGDYTGAAAWFERGRCTPQCAVIIQQPRGGRVLAVAATHHRSN